MRVNTSRAPLAIAAGTALMLAGAFVQVTAQAPTPQQAPGGGGRGGGRGGGVAPALFAATDANKDGAVARDEFTGAFDKWFTDWDAGKAGTLTAAQLTDGLNKVIAANAPPGAAPAGPPADACGGRSANPRVACPADVDKMLAAMPDKAIARPAKPRKVLVLANARGFVHSSIPLAAKMMEAMGTKTGAWTATTTYEASDITAANLKQYDAVFLDSTTGCFLDDPNDKAATDARRAALLDFIRSGKGIAAIHAATDSYHGNSCGGGGGFAGPGAATAGALVAQGDKDADQKLSRAEFSAVAAAWFDRLDTDKSGKVAQADFGPRWASLTPPGGGRQNAAAGAAPPKPGGEPLWPEWNKIIGGYFKFHWNDPQLITVKIDDPKSPLTQMFNGQDWEIRDETYTFNQESFSRDNVHVLTSVNYAKMSDEDKAKEPNQRSDHDYALSWIRREGKGRLFYEAHGHHERNYAIKPFLEHMLAGVQYAIGDLKADDSPSTKGTK